MNARELALNACARLRREGDQSFEKNLELLRREGVQDPRERDLAERIYIGSFQNRDYLQAVLAPYVRGKQHPLLKDILLTGAYQLLFLDRVPASAAVNEAVNLCRKRLNAGAASTANAILRRVSTLTGETVPLDAPEESAAYLACLYSHPLWLVEELLGRIGYDRTRRFLELDNTPSGVTVQWNTLPGRPTGPSPDFGEEVRRYPGVEDCFTVSTLTKALREQMEAGNCFVQDLSARLAVLAADPQPGETVLDPCAAPGGKTFSAILAMKGEGRVIAGDFSSGRLGRMEENLRRLGMEKLVELRNRDAAQTGAYEDILADRVFVDAPCSGFGTIRKKPEIRYKKREDLRTLPELQLRILKESAKRVRPGGLLLYSTCTIFREENEEVVARFLREESAFRPEAFSLPEPFGTAREGMMTIWPDQAESDGFFIARLRKSDE